MSVQITTGSFVNTASTPYFLPLTQKVDEFRLYNLTRSGVTSGSTAGALTSTRIVEAYFNPSYMNNGTALIKQNGTVAGILAPLNNGFAAINGFTIVNAQDSINLPAVAVASFTPGTTTEFTTGAAHGLQVGDNVRIYGMTSAPQFGGLVMTVTAVGSTTTFTTLLDSTNATTSVGFVQKVGNYLLPNPSLYYPQNRVIAKITNTNPMVVTTLVQQNYAPGNVVTFDIPSAFGIQELSPSLNGTPVQATVISANNAVGVQTVTLAIDATGFGVFATNGNSSVTNPGHWLLGPGYPFSFPYMVPQGEGNINNFQNYGVTPAPLPYANQNVLSFARQNQARSGILIGAGDGTNSATTGGLIGATSDVWAWECISSTQQFP